MLNPLELEGRNFLCFGMMEKYASFRSMEVALVNTFQHLFHHQHVEVSFHYQFLEQERDTDVAPAVPPKAAAVLVEEEQQHEGETQLQRGISASAIGCDGHGPDPRNTENGWLVETSYLHTFGCFPPVLQSWRCSTWSEIAAQTTCLVWHPGAPF